MQHPRLPSSHNLKANFTASVTKRVRRRSYAQGRVVLHERYVVNCRDRSGKRRQVFFATRREALAYRDELIARARKGDWALMRADLTLQHVLDHWLANSSQYVKPTTLHGYRRVHAYVIGPLAAGTASDRRRLTRSGENVAGEMLHMMGNPQLFEISTARIRQWHTTLAKAAGRRTAQEMKRCLGAALRLAAEDFDITIPSMPAMQSRAGDRKTKRILTPSQVSRLLMQARDDRQRGLYYAFPFLTGVRPSEQLGLRWEDIDMGDATIQIRRVQELDGTVSLATKTATSARRIPMPPLLKAMLQAWRLECPADREGSGRVFPTAGRTYGSGATARAGLPLTYYNFRANYWMPALKACSLPYVTPHSARHTYISTLQAAGVEIALVAKLAGHANANVTLSHYTHAVRGGGDAVQRLQDMYDSALPRDPLA